MAGAGKITRNPAAQRIAQTMYEAGLSKSDIARSLQVHPSNVGRYLDRVLPQIKDVRRYTEARADLLDHQQALAANVATRVLEQLGEDDLSQLSPSQKAAMLPALTMQQGTMYDKSRLERGQSTANVSLRSVAEQAARRMAEIEAELAALDAE